MFGLNAERDIRSHDSARHMRHAAGHYRHKFGAGQIGEEWPDRKRSFRLAHEDAGGDIERFSAARTHDARHHPGRDLDDELHNPVVVEHCKECSDKDNCGKDLKREIKSEVRTLFAQFSKHKLRSGEGVTQKTVHCVAGFLEGLTPRVDPQHEYGEHELQSQAPGDCFQAYSMTIGGEGIRQSEHSEEPENSSEASHSV